MKDAFPRLEDVSRVATRYGNPAANILSGVAPAAIVAFWP